MLTIGLLPSFLKRFYYRRKGASIGKGVRFGLGSILVGSEIKVGDNARFGMFSVTLAERIEIGRDVVIGSFTLLSGREVHIGDESKIDEFVYSGILEGPRSILRIGHNVHIFPFTVINPTMGVTIDDEVGVGGFSLIFTHGVWQSALEGYPYKFAPVTIKRGVWLPWNVFIMPGVTIGEGATIGARALVASDVPPRSLAVGIPAHVAKSADEYPAALTLEEKEEVVHSIFKDFAEYLTYRKQTAILEEAVGGFSVTVKSSETARITSFIYQRPGQSYGKKANAQIVMLSLAPLSESARDEFSSEGVVWIDLNTGTRSTKTTVVVDEFVEFLFRYGVRAKKVGKEIMNSSDYGLRGTSPSK
jgi:acetyltransferase-like isoleucine patch superfamily enzyme